MHEDETTNSGFATVMLAILENFGRKDFCGYSPKETEVVTSNGDECNVGVSDKGVPFLVCDVASSERFQPNLVEVLNGFEAPFGDKEEMESHLDLTRLWVQAQHSFTGAALHRGFYYRIINLCGNKPRGTPAPALPYWRQFFGPLKENLGMKNLDPRMEQQSNDKKADLIKTARTAIYCHVTKLFHESQEFAEAARDIWDLKTVDCGDFWDAEADAEDDGAPETEPDEPAAEDAPRVGGDAAEAERVPRLLHHRKNREKAFRPDAYYEAFKKFLVRFEGLGNAELKLVLSIRKISTEFEMYRFACRVGASNNLRLLIMEGLKRWDPYNRVKYAIADAELLLSRYFRSARRNRILDAHQAFYMAGVFGNGLVLDGWQEWLVALAKSGVDPGTSPEHYENGILLQSINGYFLKQLADGWGSALDGGCEAAQTKK